MQSFSTRLLDLFAKSFVVRRLRISLNTLAPHASVFAKTCCATACRPTAWIGLKAELRTEQEPTLLQRDTIARGLRFVANEE